MNAYPLLNSQAVYEGQRKAAPNQRVFILTRSGYAGQQRYAAATWSGDITSTWTAMKKQIAAGLGYSISGLPYWTMDAGGFSVPGKFSGRNASPAAVDESPATDGLARELELVRSADAALRAGDAARALTIARADNVVQLAAELSAIEIDALCALDHRDEARDHVRAFRKRFPYSALAARVARSCEGGAR